MDDLKNTVQINKQTDTYCCADVISIYWVTYDI